MDWDDLKVFLGTAVLIIGLTVGFAYVNVYISEKNDRQTMKEISSSKVVGKYSYIEKTPEQIMPVTAVNTDGILFQNTQYIPESTQIKYKVVLENGKELNVSQDIWNKAEIKKIEEKKAENLENKENRKIEFAE